MYPFGLLNWCNRRAALGVNRKMRFSHALSPPTAVCARAAHVWRPADAFRESAAISQFDSGEGLATGYNEPISLLLEYTFLVMQVVLRIDLKLRRSALEPA